VAQAGHAVHGEGTTAFTPWCVTQRHTLPYGNPEAVLGALRQLATPAKGRRAIGAIAPMQASLRYVEKRREMLEDAWCHAKGSPIGRGSVERANTRVVERRLNGTGMH
jgi:hypothetical protein